MKKAVLFSLWGGVLTPHLAQTFEKFEETTGVSRYVISVLFISLNYINKTLYVVIYFNNF